jgi:LEA14-like dessication related protein
MSIFARYLRTITAVIVMGIVLVGVSGCSVTPKLEQPEVKVVGVQLLPMQGFLQPIQVSLLISNPNDRDLSLRGLSYAVGIENFDVLTGVSNQLPTLRSYTETPVTVVVSANVLQLLQLVEHVSRSGINSELRYNFTAKLDFSAWLPSYTVKEQGVLPLSQLKK